MNEDEDKLKICAGKKAADKEKAEAIFAIVGDHSFWKNVKRYDNPHKRSGNTL